MKIQIVLFYFVLVLAIFGGVDAKSKKYKKGKTFKKFGKKFGRFLGKAVNVLPMLPVGYENEQPYNNMQQRYDYEQPYQGDWRQRRY